MAYTDAGVVTDQDLVSGVTLQGHLVGALVNDQVGALLADMRGTVLVDESFLRRLDPSGRRVEHSVLSYALDQVGSGFDADLGWVRMGQRDYGSGKRVSTTPDPLFWKIHAVYRNLR